MFEIKVFRILQITFVLVLFELTGAQIKKDIGKIYIGTENTTTGLPNTKDYVFYYNEPNPPPISVYAVVLSGADPKIRVPKTQDINITCSVSEKGTGFSDVSLQSIKLLASVNTTDISLSLIKPGRSVQLTCSGVSEQGTCNATDVQSQFCPETSKSNSVSLTVHPGRTVSISETLISVKNFPQTDYFFTVKLSDPPEQDVDVTCTTTQGTPPLELKINPKKISSGKVTDQVSYNFVSGSENSSVTVQCTGNSGFSGSGNSARFVLQTAQAKFQAIRSEIYNTTFSPVFYLSDLPEKGVTVYCSAAVVPDLTAAEQNVASPDCSFTSSTTSTTTTTTTTTPTTTTTTTTTATTTATSSPNASTSVPSSPTTSARTTPAPTPPPDPTSPWSVMKPSFDIPNKQGQVSLPFVRVTTERLYAPIDVRKEIVVTTCCVGLNSSNPFVGQRAASYAVASLAPYVCPNCPAGNSSDERVVPNPGYVEVSPCSCDLTKYACDINCCCDTDCVNANARFSGCIPGLAGGQPADDPEYRCSSRAFNPPDWQLLTCVYWEKNAYLGMFYQNRRKLAASETVDVTGRFSFSETEKRSGDSIQSGYHYGTIIQTIRDDVTELEPTRSGTLALSQSGPGGSCNPLSPVQFLVDSASVCRTVVTPDSCSELSVVSSRIYAISSTVSGGSHRIASKDKASTVAPTDVRYYCIAYTPSTSAGLENSDPLVVSNFPNDLADVNCTDGCSSEKCWNSNTNKIPADATSSAVQCDWDNGYTVRLPTVAGTMCNNAVVQVRYNFEWSGEEITKLTADVYLANIEMTSSSRVEIVQKFDVAWQAKPNTTVPKSDNFGDSTQPYVRSGTSGYVPGKPLISGCSAGQGNVDTIPQKQMAIFKPGVDGLCENAKRQEVTFGDDMSSGCVLKLNFTILNNDCERQRQLLTNHLNVLMAANVIGRYGYNNASNPDMWISVLRQSLTGTSDLTTTPATTTTATTASTASTTAASTASTTGSTSASTAAASTASTTAVTTASTSTTKPLPSLADSIPGICHLPTGIHLSVMYANTGAVNGFPRYEVTGAYINYTQSNWTLDCMGANRHRCDANSGSTQQFFVTSSIRFIQVPATLASTQSRFYTRCDPDNIDSDSCERFFTTFASGECYSDSCWRKLAYPVLSVYMGETRMYTLPFFLLFVLGVIGYVSVARPGWN